jgi:hypothetical protein
MLAEYDSEADALSIDLIEAAVWEESVSIDDTYCQVALSGGLPVNIELLSPAGGLHLLDQVADRFGIARDEVQAAARSALAAPDRQVTLRFSPAVSAG